MEILDFASLSSLTSLDISGNDISLEGINEIMKCLQDNSTLRCLKMQKMSIKSCVSTAEMLKKNTTLKQLDLYDTEIQNDFIKIIQSLTQNQSLNSITLKNYELTNEQGYELG
eukprot:gene6131-10139_t